jgi:hypothetical protein
MKRMIGGGAEALQGCGAEAPAGLARQYYGTPPMLAALRLPPTAQWPGARYLEWHRSLVFVDRRKQHGSWPDNPTPR